jgi:hypothetical protein
MPLRVKVDQIHTDIQLFILGMLASSIYKHGPHYISKVANNINQLFNKKNLTRATQSVAYPLA